MKSYFKSIFLAITIAFLIITTAHADLDEKTTSSLSYVNDCATYYSLYNAIYIPCLTIDYDWRQYTVVLTKVPGTYPALFEVTYIDTRY